MNVVQSKSVRHHDQWEISDLVTLRPLVAPLLHSGHYSLGPFGLLNRLVPLVLVSNYYVIAGLTKLRFNEK